MKNKLFLLLSILLFSCNQSNVSSSSLLNNSSSSSFYSFGLTSSYNEINPSLSEDSSNVVSNSSSSYSQEDKILNVSEIIELGNSLSEGESSKSVAFQGIYVKAITDNFDKLMLFVDESGFVYVRVIGGFNDYLKNRYTNYEYKVTGIVTKYNGNIEVTYSFLENISSNEVSFDYSKISDRKNSLDEIYQEFENVNLNNKDTGVGKIVTFEGIVMATDEDDSNTKVVVYDENNVITVINDKTICNKQDIGNKYTFTGALSVLKTGPAIWMLEKEYIEKVDVNNIDLSNAKSVTPSYFSKWYYTSDKQSKPTYETYASLYKISGYIIDDESRTNKYYLGAVDSLSDTLSDNGIKTSIEGIYLMNNLNLSENDLTYSPFYNFYLEGTKITFYASFYQFDSQNHGWKMFAFDYTITELVV